MNKLWIPVLFIAFPSLLFAKGAVKEFPISDFHCGVDLYRDPAILPDCYVQDSLNMFFDKTEGAEKRKGFSVAFSTKSYSFSGSWTYTDSSNTSWIIVRSSDQLTASNVSGTTVRISTMTSGDTANEVNAFGNAYFVDQSQGVYYWNGTSTTYVSGSPKGSLIEQFHGRLWVSGQSIPNGNILNGSKYLDGNTWTTGPNVTDPVLFQIGLNDNYDNISSLYAFLDTLYVTKFLSINAVYGFDQSDFQTRVLTKECGCIDTRTIQNFNKGMVFVSQRGIEFFDGYSCTRISDPVKNKIDPVTLSAFNSRSWIQTSQVDFQNGVSTPTTALSYTLSPNDITLSSYTNSDSTYANFGLGTFSNTQTSAGCNCVRLIDTSLGGTYYSRTFDLGMPVAYVRTGNAYDDYSGSNVSIDLQDSANGVTFTTKLRLTRNSNDFLTQVKRYVRYFVSFNAAVTLDRVNEFDILSRSSGTYVSAVHSDSNFTSWGTLNTNNSLDGGSLAFSIRSSTNVFLVSDSTPTWVSQTDNSLISGTTGTYFQFQAVFGIGSAIQSPALNDFTLNWFDGIKTPPMASIVFDNRYWLSLSTTTADAANDGSLVLNTKGVWAPMDIAAGGFTIFKGQLYHADANATGNVYLDDQGYTDNGKAINAYLTTKEFSMGDPTKDKFYDSIYVIARNLGNYGVYTSYFADNSSTEYSLGVSTQSEVTGGRMVVKLPFPIDSSHQVFSRSIAMKFKQNDNNAGFGLLGGILMYKERPVQ